MLLSRIDASLSPFLSPFLSLSKAVKKCPQVGLKKMILVYWPGWMRRCVCFLTCIQVGICNVSMLILGKQLSSHVSTCVASSKSPKEGYQENASRKYIQTVYSTSDR